MHKLCHASAALNCLPSALWCLMSMLHIYALRVSVRLVYLCLPAAERRAATTVGRLLVVIIEAANLSTGQDGRFTVVIHCDMHALLVEDN